MLSTPQAREMLRFQVMASNKKRYADEIKKLALSPAQAEALLNLLADQQMRQIETAQSLATDPAAATQAREELQSRADSEIASLLGSEKAAQFSAYEKSQGERMQVNNYADQLDAINLGMRDEQKEQLVNIMVEAKKNLPPSPLPNDPRDNQAMQARFDWQSSYNHAVLEGASSVLTPEQFDHIRSMQEWQLNLQQQSLQKMQGAQLSGPSAGAVPARSPQ
ncbi:MAG: hypothetical protein WDO68_22015 [Gammaproteobacteria bacterium]